MKISEFFEYNNQQVLEENENILEYLEQIFGKSTEIDREGKKEFTAIAINGDANDYLYPCGVCRQVMAEFCDPETFQVILVNTPDDFKIFTLEELLPGAFTKQDITKATGKEL